ncbi:MAG: signal transduction histidine kinase, partial [Myxococcota bacterium]
MKSVLPEPPESLVFAQTERDASVLRTYLRRSNAWLRVVDACLSRSRDAESLSDLCMVWARAVVETQGFNLVGAFERHGDSLEPLALIGPRPIREESLFAFDPKVGTEGRIGAAGVPVLLGTDRRELPLKYGMWGSFSRAQGDLLLVAGYDARMALLMEPPGPDGLGYLRMTGQHLLALDTEMSARAALAREHEMLQTVNDRLLRSEDELRANNSLLSLRSEELELALGTLRATQVDLLQSERLSAVGHVAAGVAHEVNNPLAYVIDDLERACELIGSQDDAG